MPRRPSLSPTKLSCYLACPHKYYWTYLSPHGQWFLRAHSYFSFGLSLHRALETFHRNGCNGVPVQAALASALEESWIDAGYSSAEEMQVAFGEAKAILDGLADEIESAPAASTLKAEVLFIEKSLRLSMGYWDLIGRADRIDRVTSADNSDSVIEIVDYKSGRSDVTPEDVAEDIAMGCYAVMVRDLFPTSQIRATIHTLRTGSRASHNFTDDQLSEFAFAVKELGERIQNHNWEEFIPTAKAICLGCEFRSLCLNVPEYAREADINPQDQR